MWWKGVRTIAAYMGVEEFGGNTQQASSALGSAAQGLPNRDGRIPSNSSAPPPGQPPAPPPLQTTQGQAMISVAVKLACCAQRGASSVRSVGAALGALRLVDQLRRAMGATSLGRLPQTGDEGAR